MNGHSLYLKYLYSPYETPVTFDHAGVDNILNAYFLHKMYLN